MTPDSLAAAVAALPHGPEFRFLDRLTRLEPGQSGGGTYRVPEEAAFLAAHFPGHPLMPGVLLIEALAQLGGVIAQSDPVHPPLEDLRLAGVRGVRLFGSASPGELLELEARITARLGGVVQVEGEIRNGTELLLRGTLSLGGRPPL